MKEIELEVDWQKILYKLLIFDVNMIQKIYNDNWKHNGIRT